ncbi:MAG: 23S rRNA (guanosine(2251)-2'-O)-methyltransferase RlmB [Holosporaceae bacterium]|jgi:23S rRNA (guanosine2251-2'-O)-methyltransferase|nr:23S rRNA (guanosine(2251)-2'-O)-methyltransferase RlmB [Holosporaceae bacterium]
MLRKNEKELQWLYGKHAVKAALRNPEREIQRFVLLKQSIDFQKECGTTAEIVDGTFFSELFGREAVHQGCAVCAKRLREYRLEEIIEDPADLRPLVFLDQVTDPQNLGSILRSAAVFGARAVVTTENNSPKLTATVAKAASGALEIIPLVRVVNLVQSMKFLQKMGFWSLGLEEKASKILSEVPLADKFVLVVGGEGTGLRRLTKESCDFLAKLPTGSSLGTLNASQAITVALYESLRQRENAGHDA